MPRRRIHAQCKQMSGFERGCSIRLKEARSMNRRFARHLGRSKTSIRRGCKSGSSMTDISVRKALVY
ncbi:hypothetical protein TNCV_1707871 [Trichonephila clavipes]|uniref:Uncharacterized protein n=1 Tax=Trichonephila clavipes TaxID=2585209 RepID=A0A8X6RJ20_TRICX|nr:hypothetical protein TNCV_1707871 [Trichonephila clavipes]